VAHPYPHPPQPQAHHQQVYYVPAPPQPLAPWLARLRAIAGALATAIATIGMAWLSPTTGVLVWAVLPLPFALLGLRYGNAVAMTCAAVVTAVTAGLVAVTGGGVGVTTAVAVLVACTAGGISFAYTQVGVGRAWERRPFVVSVCAWLALCAALVACVMAFDGVTGARHDLRGMFSQAYAQELQQSCSAHASLRESADMCSSIRDQRDSVLSTIDHHAAAAVAIAAAVIAFVHGALSLWLLRSGGSRMNVPLRPPIRFREFEADWPVAYLLAAGLVLFMAGDAGGSSFDAVTAVGAVLGTLGALVLLANGMAVVSWLFARARVRVLWRVILWGSLIFAWWIELPVIGALAIWDVVAHPRRKAANVDRMDGRGAGS
jgi:hypothetical protein